MSRFRSRRRPLLLLCAALAVSCSHEVLFPSSNRLADGTWGGDNAAVLVTDDVAHVHVGCTLGDFPAPLDLDDAGRFNVSGSYVLRAFPVQVGPSLPAQFAGVVSGRRLTFTVAVNDTVEKRLVVLGPHTVDFEREPRMQVCPICALKVQR